MKMFGLNRLAGVMLAAAIAGVPLAGAMPAFAQEEPAPAAEEVMAEEVMAEEAAPAEEVVVEEEAVEEEAAEVVLAHPHQQPLELDSAATAWILVSSALVLLMTIPGLALFYGGMTRRKNIINTVATSFATVCVVTIVWFGITYGMAFGVNPDETLNGFVGSFSVLGLSGVTIETAHSATAGLPEYLWVMFQLTFAIITPALIAGAFAERMKFSGMLLFMALWSIFVYAPICHQVWGGGFLGGLGVLDFAGGTVVHINAGVAGLVCALVLGKRTGYGTENMAPNNLVYTMIGASLLWVGWFGFNAGSEWAADGLASAAMLNTQMATAGAALSWMLVEWFDRKKPGMLGLASGAVAGLVAVTPAAGFVNPTGALIIGLVAGVGCYAGAVWIKKAFKYDDSLDAFGVHGIGGIIGALLTGVFADTMINSAGEGASVVTQGLGILSTIAWSGVGTFVILMVCKFTVGIRVTAEAEVDGLDAALHGEAHHN
jgi:Amt family ammonium transporter